MYDSRVVFQIDADTKSFDNQIEKVEEELNDLLNRYDETKNMKPFKGKEEDLRQLGVEIEKTANKLKGLKQQQDRVAQGTTSLGKESQKTGTQMSKGFEKGLKSVKKLALGIVGIRGAYMLARRAASAYMSADEDLAKKMQTVWTGLGSFLAPLLEMITNLMLKFVGYLNEFIKALTGTDYIARANAKALEKQAKAQAQLNKETEKYQNYDFDVIRTQQTNQSVSASGSGSDTPSGLIEIPELNKGIVKKLQDLAKWLKENKDLIEAVGIALGVTFGAVAIGKLLANIGALIGSSTLLTGLLGILALLGLIATVWTIKIVIDNINEVKDLLNEVAAAGDKLIDKAEEQYSSIFNTPKEERNTEKYRKKVETAQSYKIEDLFMDDFERSYKQYLNSMVSGFGIFTKEDKKILQNNADMLAQEVNTLIEFASRGELTESGLKNLITFSQRYGKEIGKINDITKRYDINQDRLNEAIMEYSGIYPDVLSHMLGYNNASKEQQKQIADLTAKFLNGKITIFEYTTEMNKIPLKVSTKIETPGLIDAGKNVSSYIANVINTIPKEKTTKANFDDKDAETKTTNYKNNLLNLPNTVLTTIKATLDTSAADWQMQQFKQKISNFPIVGSMFSKLFSVMGFAGGGYISQPTLAMVGEGKYNEYVIPEGEDYISRLASEIGRYGGGGGTTNVYLDGRLIQRQVNKTANQVSFTRNGR